MVLLIIGLALFLGVHCVSIFAEDFRDRMVAKNERTWKGVYSLFSLIGLALICKGYILAQSTAMLIYMPPVWLRHVMFLLLIPVFVLMLAPYFPGKISRAIPHPQLLAVKIWAVAHLLANGFLADIVLFGAFLAWAVIDRISLEKRRARAAPGMPDTKANDWLLVIIGLGLYLLTMVWLHELLIGVAPVLGT